MNQFEKEAINLRGILETAARGAKSVGSGLASVPGRVAGAPGATGSFVLNTARRGLNNAGAVGEAVLRGAVENIPMNARVAGPIFHASQSMKNVGTRTVGALQRGAEKLTGMGHTGKFNPLNVAVGAGTLYGGAKALGVGGGGAAQAAPAAAPSASPAQQFGAQAAQQAGMGGFGGFSQKAKEMWGALPTEAKWALGAGVPMALAGGLMGGKGGLGLGALGLGAAGLGAAAGGLLGDDARRMVGKGMYNVGSFFGGGGNDPGSQIEMLKKFSPGLGSTLLMGRDPNLSAAQAQKQYEFLTQNSDMIKALLPSMQQKGASALYDMTIKGARCWKGYEPVPGKAPYSEDSCRPAGSKKKKPAAKKQAASTVFKLTEKKPEEVVNGDKPSTEASKEVSVTRSEPAKKEDLRPEGALGELGKEAARGDMTKKLLSYLGNNTPFQMHNFPVPGRMRPPTDSLMAKYLPKEKQPMQQLGQDLLVKAKSFLPTSGGMPERGGGYFDNNQKDLADTLKALRTTYGKFHGDMRSALPKMDPPPSATANATWLGAKKLAP